MTAGGGVGVLAVLGACYGQASTVSAEFPNNTLLADHKARVLVAKVRIAELIAADREYDAARSLVDGLRDGVSTIGEVLQARHGLTTAAARRASALAALEQN